MYLLFGLSPPYLQRRTFDAMLRMYGTQKTTLCLVRDRNRNLPSERMYTHYHL